MSMSNLSLKVLLGVVGMWFFMLCHVTTIATAAGHYEMSYECISASKTPFSGTLTIDYKEDTDTTETTGQMILSGHEVVDGKRISKVTKANVVGSLYFRIIAQTQAVGHRTSWYYQTFIFTFQDMMLKELHVRFLDDTVQIISERTETYACTPLS